MSTLSLSAFGGGGSSAPRSSKQFDYKSIISTYTNLFNQANAANEGRYQDILTRHAAQTEQVGSTFDSMTSLLENLGTAERERIEIDLTASVHVDFSHL